MSWKALERVPLWRAARWTGGLLGLGLGAWLGFAVLAPVGKLLALALAGGLGFAGLVSLVRRREGGCLLGGMGLGGILAILLTPASVWPIGAAILVGALSSWLGGKALRAVLARFLVKRGGLSLRESKKLIAQRLRELRQRLRRMRLLQRQVPAAPSGELSVAATQALTEGEGRLHEQFARYRAQAWRTDYARWRNEVVAIAEDADERAVDGKSVGELQLLDDAGRRLLAEIRRDAEALATEEGADGEGRLEETLHALENLRQKVMYLVVLSESSSLPSADATAFDRAAADPRVFEALHGEPEECDYLEDLARLEADHAALSAELDAAPGKRRDRSRG